MPSRLAEDDPVVKQYKVFVNKPTRHIMILQYPNRERDKPYCSAGHQKPLELRIKPKSGLVELDIPTPVTKHYDKIKGAKFQEAVEKSRPLQAGGSYGMAGGLGVGGYVRSGIKDENARAPRQEGLETKKVLKHLTLGGQIVPSNEGDPIYFVGTFNNDELHLSKVDAIVQLRPQFHHLDAIVDGERHSSRIQREAENPAPESEARAVNMTVKSSEDDELDMSVMAKSLKAIQAEPWQRLQYVDEEDARAYSAYNQQLFLPDADDSAPLISTMTNEQYLDAISAPRIDPTAQGRKLVMTNQSVDIDSDTEVSGEDSGVVGNVGKQSASTQNAKRKGKGVGKQ